MTMTYEQNAVINLAHVTEKAGFNVRQDAGNIDDLVDSMRVNGILQPVVLRIENDCYTVVAGHRRVRAARRLNWKTIPAVVLPSTITDNEAALLNIAENAHRRDVPLHDRCKRLYELLQSGIPMETLVMRLEGKLSRGMVQTYVRYYQRLCPELKKVWADPSNPANPLLSASTVSRLCAMPADAQVAEFESLCGLKDEGAVKVHAETRGPRVRPGRNLCRRPLVEALVTALHADGEVSADFRRGALAVANFVLRESKRVTSGQHVVYAAPPRGGNRRKP